MTELIITFRETLEASLIIGIVLAYLSQTGRRAYQHAVFLAAFLAALFSGILAVIFTQFFGGFTGRVEELFEGMMTIVASVMVSTVIIWMMGQTKGRKQIHDQVEFHLKKSQKIGLFMLIFLSVLREGVEMVLFLSATSLENSNNWWLALTGVGLAVLAGVVIFKIGIRLSLKPFFIFSSLFLILVGAGLFAHGIHELEEAGLINPIIEHLWEINGFLNDKVGLGLLLKKLFGYNSNPSLLEVGGYFAYLNLIYFYHLFINHKN